MLNGTTLETQHRKWGHKTLLVWANEGGRKLNTASENSLTNCQRTNNVLMKDFLWKKSLLIRRFKDLSKHLYVSKVMSIQDHKESSNWFLTTK